MSDIIETVLVPGKGFLDYLSNYGHHYSAYDFLEIKGLYTVWRSSRFSQLHFPLKNPQGEKLILLHL